MTVRFGLLGDVHAEDARVEAALALFASLGTDAVLCVGDVVDGRGDANRTVRMLEAAGVLAVRGNHDRWLLGDTMRSLPGAHTLEGLSPESVAWLGSLPPTRVLSTPIGDLLLCHGIAGNDMARLRPHDEGYALSVQDELHAMIDAGDFRIMVGGHTHERMVRRFGDLVVVNAGTLKGDDDPCCSVLDAASGHVTFFDFDEGTGLSEAGRYDLEPRVFPA